MVRHPAPPRRRGARSRRARACWSAAAAALLVLSACGGGDDPGPPPPVGGVPATIAVVAGDGQVVDEHAPLRVDPVFEVRDGLGATVARSTVVVSAGLRSVVVVTGLDGRVTVGASVEESHRAVTSFHRPGPATITAALPGAEARAILTLTVLPTPFRYDGVYACNDRNAMNFGIANHLIQRFSGVLDVATGEVDAIQTFGSAVAFRLRGRITIDDSGQARLTGTAQTVARGVDPPPPAEPTVCSRY